MSFINLIEINNLKGKLTSDSSQLGKIYKAKKSRYQTRSVDHSLVDDLIADGWEVERVSVTKTKLKQVKNHSRQFEDDIWCQFYELGYRHMNYDDTCKFPFSSAPEDKKQIDIVAIDSETVFLIECKSSEKLKKAPSYRDTFETLGQRLNGFRKVIEQAFGKGLKVKYIFATRNLQINIDDLDISRLTKTNSFYYNDNTYDYINNPLFG